MEQDVILVVMTEVTDFPEDQPSTPFAFRLEIVRRHYGEKISRHTLSAAEFAGQLGIEGARYRRYERGEMEPPLEVLQLIRAMTGVSLDWLVAGISRAGIELSQMVAPGITVGKRLRWVREIVVPSITECADLMSLPLELWIRYERDAEPLPLAVATEFAHRFAVSLDYLYRGELQRIAPALRAELLRRHPELRQSITPGDNHMEMGGYTADRPGEKFLPARNGG